MFAQLAGFDGSTGPEAHVLTLMVRHGISRFPSFLSKSDTIRFACRPPRSGVGNTGCQVCDLSSTGTIALGGPRPVVPFT